MRRFIVASIAFAVLQSYASTVMIVHSSNGSRDVYQLSNVQKIAFSSMAVGTHNGTNDPAGNTFSVANRSIRLSLTKRTMVKVRLFSSSGRVCGTLLDKQYDAGSYILPLYKTGTLARGVYIVQVAMAGRTINHKMVVSR